MSKVPDLEEGFTGRGEASESHELWEEWLHEVGTKGCRQVRGGEKKRFPAGRDIEGERISRWDGALNLREEQAGRSAMSGVLARCRARAASEQKRFLIKTGAYQGGYRERREGGVLRGRFPCAVVTFFQWHLTRRFNTLFDTSKTCLF